MNLHCELHFHTGLFWWTTQIHSNMFCFSHQCPPGMKQQVLTFYTKLLAHIRQPLLPHINVHRPVLVRNYAVWFLTDLFLKMVR